MPELPEVENVRRNLESMVVGRTIASVDVRLPRIIRTPDDTVRFAAELAGCTIQSVSRRGKYLLFSVPPYTLVSHLRMEGQYLWVAADEPVAPHTHVIFHFDDHTELRYRDVRQFGTMDLIEPGQPLPKGLLALGPEPFSEDLDHDGLYRRVHRRTASIKAVLLDQAVLAGLGNIYVDEALFRAGIHPARPAHQLTRAEAQTLVKAIREVLTEAIEAGGSSIRTYVDGYGRHGGFQIRLNVYGRQGQPCQTCGSEIVKLRIAGRGTHVCPLCQPKSRRHEAVRERAGKGEVSVP